MSGDAERQDRDADTLPPPASTRWVDEERGEGDEARPLPPFFAGDAPAQPVTRRTGTGTPAQAPEEDMAETSPAKTQAEPAPEREEREEFPFEAVAEGAAGPAVAHEPEIGEGDEDDFPVQAFDVPGLRETAGAPAAAARAASDAEAAMADRLERLAARLRDEGPGALAAELDRGDRFDGLLAGMVAGYLAARGD